jgi:hypothetical protein
VLIERHFNIKGLLDSIKFITYIQTYHSGCLHSFNALPGQSHMHNGKIIQLFPTIHANGHSPERILKLYKIRGIGNFYSNNLIAIGRPLALE